MRLSSFVRRLSARALLGGMLCLTTACGFEATAPDAASDGGTLRFISEEAIDTLDPQGTSWLIDFRVIECLFEPLLRANPATGELEPAAAAALPEVSADGRTYTFTLRDDAKWSNGDALRSADFVYAWRRAIMPDLGADYSGLFLEIEGAQAFSQWRSKQLKQVSGKQLEAHAAWLEAKQHFADTVGLSTPDDRTLVVRLRRPVAYFNELAAFAAFMPLHAASAEAFESIDADAGTVTWGDDYFKDPEVLVGNGPYQLTRWSFKRELVVDANPHYWARDRVANARVVVQVVVEIGTALLRYGNGEVDLYPGVSTTEPQAAELVAAGLAGERTDVHYGPAAGTYFYLFNCKPQVNGKPNPLADSSTATRRRPSRAWASTPKAPRPCCPKPAIPVVKGSRASACWSTAAVGTTCRRWRLPTCGARTWALRCRLSRLRRRPSARGVAAPTSPSPAAAGSVTTATPRPF